MTRRIGRRAFLGSMLAGLAAGCGWDGGTALTPALGRIGLFNDWLSERLFSPTKRAPKYRRDERSSSFPSYHISPTTPILADPASWRLRVRGLVRRELTLSIDEIRALDPLTYTVKHHCVEGWSAIAAWTGAPLHAVAELAEPLDEARYLRFDSFDAGYYNGWDRASAMHPETILAYGFNDGPLTPAYGAPLRLYAPHKLGYKLTKYLTTITFTSERPGGYWEDRGYPWFAGV